MKASVRHLGQWVPHSQYPFFLPPFLPSITFQLKGAHVDQAGLTLPVVKDDLELQILFLLHSVFLGAQLLKRDLLVSMFGDRFAVQYISLKASHLHLYALDLPIPLPQTQRLSTFHALRRPGAVWTTGYEQCIAIEQNKNPSTSTLHSKCHILDHKDPHRFRGPLFRLGERCNSYLHRRSPLGPAL